MTDIFTPEKRSYVMSRIKGKGTKIEKIMEKILKDNNLRTVSHPKMFGSPDFMVGKHMLVFCDGDFWHGYRYDEKKKIRKKFWREKIEGNIKRDRKVSRNLRREGWSVLRFWEHDIQTRPELCKNRILRFLDSV